jgi:hypothetical protein
MQRSCGSLLGASAAQMDAGDSVAALASEDVVTPADARSASLTGYASPPSIDLEK